MTVSLRRLAHVLLPLALTLAPVACVGATAEEAVDVPVDELSGTAESAAVPAVTAIDFTQKPEIPKANWPATAAKLLERMCGVLKAQKANKLVAIALYGSRTGADVDRYPPTATSDIDGIGVKSEIGDLLAEASYNETLSTAMGDATKDMGFTFPIEQQIPNLSTLAELVKEAEEGMRGFFNWNPDIKTLADGKKCYADAVANVKKTFKGQQDFSNPAFRKAVKVEVTAKCGGVPKSAIVVLNKGDKATSDAFKKMGYERQHECP